MLAHSKIANFPPHLYLAKKKSAVKFLLIFTTNPVISGEHAGSPLHLI
ncbi:hypothetical protein ACLSZN_07890 [Avibacterium avium]